MLETRYENAILITVDSLRWDAIFTKDGQIREDLAFFRHISKNSIIFRNAFSNGAGTPACFPSIMTSTYPLMYGGYRGISNKKRKPIAKVLKKEGFFTLGVSNNAYLSKFFGYNRGFDIFSDILDQNETSNLRKMLYKLSKFAHKDPFLLDLTQGINMFLNINPPYLEGEDMNKQLYNLIGSNKNIFSTPYFVWLHYMDPHLPYYSPRINYKISNFRIRKLHLKLWLYKHARWLISDKDLKDLKYLHEMKVKYLDKALSELFAKLDKNGMLKDTLVIFTADHGEEFLEHGDFIHPPKLYDELIHVPLIIYAKDIEGPVYVDELVEHLDIAPTILGNLGVEIPKGYLGMNILSPNKKKDYIISEVGQPEYKLIIDYNLRKIAVRTKKVKFIWDNGKNTMEMYNLIQDPREKINIVNKNPEAAKLFKEIIKRHEKRLKLSNG